MASKRSRAAFEADLQAHQSPYVLFGTPLPPLDPDVRDDGSYLPVWKQEVRDDRGRRRLHGAFTGGWSAGYFNTVGSKEGWTPSTFVSSRSQAQAQAQKQKQQSVDDFMDDEDRADAAERQQIHTADSFAGLGSAYDDDGGGGTSRPGGAADLFRPQGDTMGVKLLRRMGWKDGQGIGPKVRRKARLDAHDAAQAQTYLFAPENVAMVAFVKKLDRKGLGFEGEARLAPSKPEAGESSEDDHDEGPLFRPRIATRPAAAKKKAKPARGGIGIGILNDTGSDDDDPYEVGPRISYNRVIGGDSKKKKSKIKANTASNPALGSAPVFRSRKAALASAGSNIRKCHDGRLPLDGFVFGADTDTLTTTINTGGNKYPPPVIPEGWKSSRLSRQESAAAAAPGSQPYLSTADAAKASTLDPKSRAALLGEAQLPGKSVFDFLSPAARERLASATGKSNLPQALGEIPEGYTLTEEERRAGLERRVPPLDRDTALAAIARGAAGRGGGGGPYADDEAKRARYRAYLEWGAGLAAAPPSRPPGVGTEDYLREMAEFQGCARIFRPMTGAMASRFTTSSSSSVPGQHSSAAPVPSAPRDPAEEAASLGMHGAMTRSVSDFHPTRLLCKRFGVTPPAHAAPDREQPGGGARQKPASAAAAGASSAGAAGRFQSVGLTTPGAGSNGTGGTGGEAMTLDDLIREGAGGTPVATATTSAAAAAVGNPQPVQPEVNEAVEGRRAQDEVLRAIFGDDEDDDDDDEG